MEFRKINNTPKISIIVASYNYEKYITRNLNSLINQTYDNYEIIVIDDGSTDNSPQIIKEYEQKYSKIKYLEHENHENKGLTKSILFALEHSKGDYIAFCESDDYWSENHLAEKVKCIQKFPSADIIVNPPNIYGDDVENYYKSFYVLFYKLGHLKRPKNMLYDMYNTCTFPTFSCVMVKKEKLLNANYNTPIQNGLDIWLWKQLVTNCKVMYVDKKITFWYRHESNAGKAINKELQEKNYTNKLYLCYIQKNLKYTLFQKLGIFIQRVINKFYKISVIDEYFTKQFLGFTIYKKKINFN